jgi:hypothetical protein
VAGGPGVGKSEVLLALTAFFRDNGWGHTVLVVSHTGAAVSRVGGRTIDSVLHANSTRTNTVVDGQRRSTQSFKEGTLLSTIGHVAIVLFEETWTGTGEQLSRWNEMLQALHGGGKALFFGGVQMCFFGDPMQLGPLSKSGTPLLPPSIDLGNNQPAAGGRLTGTTSAQRDAKRRRTTYVNAEDRGTGQWLFSNVPQDVFVLYEQHRIDDPAYAKICSNLRRRWLHIHNAEERYAQMEEDARVLSGRWLGAGSPKRVELLEEIKVRLNALAQLLQKYLPMYIK